VDDDDPGGLVTAIRASAIEALLAELVDYAGLFPPAALPMADAVRNYAEYRTGAHRAMLGRFVLPAARMEEFVEAAREIPADGAPWPLSVLAGAQDGEVLAAFTAAHGARWRIDTVEAKAATSGDVAALTLALALRYVVYVEIPAKGDPAKLIEAIGSGGMRAKIRTGGVTRDAFPAPIDVLQFITTCVSRRVPFKATAGLHHPVRGEYPLTYAPESERGTMYGFLNLFLAAVLLHGKATTVELIPLLEERDASAIVVTDDAIRWRAFTADVEAILAARRDLAGSFGSCSFDEPVRDLAALDILPSFR
jgi:hypothetical protein